MWTIRNNSGDGGGGYGRVGRAGNGGKRNRRMPIHSAQGRGRLPPRRALATETALPQPCAPCLCPLFAGSRTAPHRSFVWKRSRLKTNADKRAFVSGENSALTHIHNSLLITPGC